ncbi:MAG: DNA internalization-related competence protein ComEC/Rec2 [Deltaproteobacteria bacterium]|nr:DNA internalization-related competence protein ComEC/Rec2 [Deltaproteobacteria bacterium]
MIPCVFLLAAGIWAADRWQCSPLISVILNIGGLVGCGIAWWYRRRGLLLVAIAGLPFAAGAARMAVFSRPPADAAQIARWLPAGGASLLCEGGLVGRPAVGTERSRVVIDLTHCRRDATSPLLSPAHGRVALSLDLAPESLQAGDRVRFLATLHRPRAYRNGFRDVRWLRQRIEGIDAVGFLSDPRWIAPLAADGATGMRHRFERWTASVETAIAAVAAGDARGVLFSLITGNGRALSQEAWDRFRRVGLIHLLVISGFQVTCVGLLAWTAAWWTIRRSSRLLLSNMGIWIALALGCAAVGGYTLFVGAEAPIQRAALMAGLVFLALGVTRRRDGASGLAAAASGVLLWSPAMLFLPSFQLTFATVAGLILWWPWLRDRSLPAPPEPPVVPSARGRLQYVWRAGVSAGCAGVAAAIGGLPWLCYHFHDTSLLGLVTTVAIGPIVGFVLTPLGLLFACIVPWWPAGALWLGTGLRLLADNVLWAVAQADRVSAPWQIGWTPSGWEIVGWYAAWAVPLLARRSAARGIAIATAILCLGAGGTLRLGDRFDTGLRITFFDVGQGSAALVRFPNRRTMLVDAGGIAGSSFDIGRFVLAPALHRRQVHTVETLVLTHHHPDHYGGLAYLAKAFSPTTLRTNGGAPEPDDPAWPLVAERLADTGIATIAERYGNPVREEGGVRITTWHPGPEGPQAAQSPNDNSLVHLLEYGAMRILLTGDAERATEAALLARGLAGPIDLLQIPHHGSDTSSTAPFLERLRPRHAVISCGQDNRYGFPAPAVLARLRALGTAVYRTDRDGAVTVWTNGKTMTVRTVVRE